MSEINLVDVTIHIDADLQQKVRDEVENGLRNISGVVSVHMPKDKPHLVTVEYVPEKTEASHIHECVRELAGHAELIGL